MRKTIAALAVAVLALVTLAAVSGADTSTLPTLTPGAYTLTPGNYTWVCTSGITNGANPGYYGVANTSTCATPPPTTTTTVPPNPTPPGLSMGSYNGAGNYSGNLSFGSETNSTVTNYSDYADSNSECNSGEPYPLALIKGHLSGQRLILSVPLSGFQLGVNGQSLLASDAANPNPWDACMNQLATYLVADGFSNAIIRLMWEPDSGYYSSGDLTSAQNYATVWRDTWNAMQVSGQHFGWAWYWGANFDSATNNAAYPGSQYVDYVTFDQYDQSWDGNCGISWGSTWTASQSSCIWNGDISNNLSNLANFAAAQGKPIGIGEWGVINRGDGHGGGDDPTFIDNMSAWFKAHAQWISYFNFNSGGDSILSDYPNSLAEYRNVIG